MTTRVHFDERAPKRERWQVLRAQDGQEFGGRWILTESFSTERDAKAFAQGFTLGSQYAPLPEPIDDRLSEALRLVKLARDEYKAECRRLREQLREQVAA